MAQNISLLGADYPAVPAVQLPKTGGGTATFIDPTELIISEWVEIENSTAIGANASGNFAFDVTKQGYKALGVVGYTGSGTTGTVIQEIDQYNSGNSVRLYLRNVTGSPITPSKLEIEVLYIKTSF